MKLRIPSYCVPFRCTAERCSDNCCIGWEIGIDEETALFYKSLEGDFGDRLRENISAEDTFILKKERCPFLNEKNLCDIIMQLGDEHLCQICRDHPRYFEWYGEIKEGGIGLCCEEGARLILTAESPCEITESEINEPVDQSLDETLFGFLYQAREMIFDRAVDAEISFETAIREILTFSAKLQENVDNNILSFPEFEAVEPCLSEVTLEDVFERLERLEAIDESWSRLLDWLKQKNDAGERDDSLSFYGRRLFVYFIWRHFLKGVFDGEFLSSVKLAAVSTVTILYIIRKKKADKDKPELKDIIDVCKLYSKQMEYSEENLAAFAEMSYTEECFSVESISALLDF